MLGTARYKLLMRFWKVEHRKANPVGMRCRVDSATDRQFETRYLKKCWWCLLVKSVAKQSAINVPKVVDSMSPLPYAFQEIVFFPRVRIFLCRENAWVTINGVR